MDADTMAAFWTLLGVIVGIAGKYVADLLLAKKSKLREEKLKWSVEFLAAASRLAQAVASQSNWHLELQNTIASEADSISADDRSDRVKRSKEERAQVQSAWSDAYRARSAVRLLMPAVTEAVNDYLDLCGSPVDPSAKDGDSADSRRKIEAALRKQVGV